MPRVRRFRAAGRPSRNGRRRGCVRRCRPGLPCASVTVTYSRCRASPGVDPGNRGCPMPLLGCIADDFTGATDLCSMLVRSGMRTVQLIGVPRADRRGAGRRRRGRGAEVAHRAGARRRCSESLAALAWLRGAGCRQFFFKYCSTFDSTDAGQYRSGRRCAAGARSAAASRWPARRFPPTRAPSTRATCSSAACC